MVVVQHGVVSSEYFLDKMKPYELDIICDGLHLRNKDSWEQTRMLCYVMAQVNSKKKLKVTDLMTFPWEKGFKKVEKKEVTHIENPVKEYEMLKQFAQQRESELKRKGII